MKKILFPLFLLFATFQAMAQQEMQYTQFMYNKLYVNPAYAGARGIPFITGIYRNQWMGFEGAPQSALLSFNSPFLSPRVGIGVTLGGYEIGLQNDFNGSLAYSYDLVASEDVSVRAGISGSIRSLSYNFNNAEPGQIGDNSLDNQRVNDFHANVGAGIYCTFADKYYVGFSVPKLYSNSIGFSNPDADLTAKEYRHYYGMAGAVITLNDDLNLLPAVLFKYVENAPFDLDLNVNLEIMEKVTAGLSYRLGGDGPGESVDLLVYWQVHPQFGVGAAYDFPLSDIRDYSAGSIELLLQADLKRVKKNMSNPRFFM